MVRLNLLMWIMVLIERLVDFLGLSGRLFSVCDVGLIEGKVLVWIGVLFWIMVVICVKYCCCSVGVWNLVEVVVCSVNYGVKL